jgi:hypothetical protein
MMIVMKGCKKIIPPVREKILPVKKKIPPVRNKNPPVIINEPRSKANDIDEMWPRADS